MSLLERYDIMDEQKKLLDEIRKDQIAFELLKDKAEWEGMPLLEVLYEWGDPREWNSYKREKDVSA
jgi:hypothetical protein